MKYWRSRIRRRVVWPNISDSYQLNSRWCGEPSGCEAAFDPPDVRAPANIKQRIPTNKVMKRKDAKQ